MRASANWGVKVRRMGRF